MDSLETQQTLLDIIAQIIRLSVIVYRHRHRIHVIVTVIAITVIVINIVMFITITIFTTVISVELTWNSIATWLLHTIVIWCFMENWVNN